MPGPDAEVRTILARAIKRCPKSRAQIADEMAVLLGRQITASMLFDFTAPTKSLVRFPAAWVPAFCSVTGSDRLQRLLLGDDLLRVLEWGELQLRANRLRGEIPKSAAASRRNPKLKKVS